MNPCSARGCRCSLVKPAEGASHLSRGTLLLSQGVPQWPAHVCGHPLHRVSLHAPSGTEGTPCVIHLHITPQKTPPPLICPPARWGQVFPDGLTGWNCVQPKGSPGNVTLARKYFPPPSGNVAYQPTSDIRWESHRCWLR